MKPLSLFLICAVLLACEKETVDYGFGEYYVEIATALGEDAFLLDSGKTVENANKETLKDLKAGDRVYLQFSYLKESSNQITVHGAAKVAKGELQTVDNQDISEYVNDPIRFESAWIGSRYLNLSFYIEYKSEAHKIALLTDKEKVNDSEVEIYFRHDLNNDRPGYPTGLYVSYDLSEALGEPKGDRTLRIHFNTTDYGDTIYKFNY